jgi:hypothetical protein
MNSADIFNSDAGGFDVCKIASGAFPQHYGEMKGLQSTWPKSGSCGLFAEEAVQISLFSGGEITFL